VNPSITALHATARQRQFLADAERRHLARQARVQRSTGAAKADTLTTLVSRLTLGRKPRVVQAHAA
jgi:hypothetical protein